VDTGDQLCRGELDLLGKVGELQESIDRPDENVVEERAMGSVEIRMQPACSKHICGVER